MILEFQGFVLLEVRFFASHLRSGRGGVRGEGEEERCVGRSGGGGWGSESGKADKERFLYLPPDQLTLFRMSV